jgi:hypothetical protein
MWGIDCRRVGRNCDTIPKGLGLASEGVLIAFNQLNYLDQIIHRGQELLGLGDNTSC